MTGSFLFDPAMSGHDDPYYAVHGTATFPRHLGYNIAEPEISDTLLDKLMGRMMEHTRLVIIPCRHCGSHNAFSNPTCIQCGAPMGEINGR